MKKRCLAMIMAFCVALSLVPATALATGGDGNEEGTPSAGSGSTIYVDVKNGNDTQDGVGTAADKAYKTLETAVTAAASGDTIQLGEGKYTLYKKGAKTTGKNLTFVGQGADKTEWGMQKFLIQLISVQSTTAITALTAQERLRSRT